MSIATTPSRVPPEHILQVFTTISSMVSQALQEDSESIANAIRALAQITANAAGGADTAGADD